MNKTELYNFLLKNPIRQIDKCLEEMCEFGVELHKFKKTYKIVFENNNDVDIKTLIRYYRRMKSLLKELVDVIITTEQMIMLFADNETIEKIKNEKLERTFKREVEK